MLRRAIQLDTRCLRQRPLRTFSLGNLSGTLHAQPTSLHLTRHLPPSIPKSRFYSSSSSFSSPLWTRRAFVLVPLSGGVLLYLNTRRSQPPTVPSLLALPYIIPPSRRSNSSLEHHPISSPAESNQSILHILYDRIIEPLLTARRFVYLFFIFMPVLVTAPMLLIGLPEPRLGGERWGAVWWYGFLVSRMQRAGPTFIKVSLHHSLITSKHELTNSYPARPMGRLPRRPIPRHPLRPPRQTPLKRSPTQPSLHKTSNPTRLRPTL